MVFCLFLNNVIYFYSHIKIGHKILVSSGVVCFKKSVYASNKYIKNDVSSLYRLLSHSLIFFMIEYGLRFL